MVGDPTLFLTFYELKYRPSIPTFSKVISSCPKPRRNNHYCASQFRSLVFRGDAKLTHYTNSILTDLLGQHNRLLHQFVYVNWTANKTTEELTRLYRLQEYVGWGPKSPREIKHAAKFWVDLWKAWWGACFWEREVWGDDVDDLLFCLRGIMAIKYRGFVHEYSTNRRVIRERSFDYDRMNIVRREQVVERPVQRGNAPICECLGPAVRGNEDNILGYLATIPDSRVGISIYAAKKSRAVSTAIAYAKRGFKSNLI